MTIEKKIELIAERYGYEPQSRQCIEEMAYLNYAVAVKVPSWFWRGTACEAN